MGEIRTVVSTECLSLYNSTYDCPERLIGMSLAFHKTMLVCSILSLASLAMFREPIVWLALVSGIQLTNRLSEGECTGPSQRGISGLVYYNSFCLLRPPYSRLGRGPQEREEEQER